MAPTPQDEAKLRELREILDAAIAKGGSFSDEEVKQALEARAVELAQKISTANSSD
jgi:hypothetical protein